MCGFFIVFSKDWCMFALW